MGKVSEKELFYDWDIAAIWQDTKLKPIDCYLLVNLILLTRTMEYRQLPDGSVAYETPIPWLVENTSLSDGGIHSTLQKLQECGYIRVEQYAGKFGKKRVHIIFTGLHRVIEGPELLQNALMTQIQVDTSPDGKAYQIKSKYGYGIFYAHVPKVIE